MDYSEMSDRDIDYLVLQRIYGNQAQDRDIMRAWMRGCFQYTNNPADAWPIITANLMRITPIYGAEVIWLVSRDVHAATDENPLRAAMLVYLQLQEAK